LGKPVSRPPLAGEDAVREMIGHGLTRLEPGDEMSARNLEQAESALAAARVLAESGFSEAALTQAYDSARKSATALLERQRLRATVKGSHRTTQDVLRHQLGRGVSKQFDMLRQSRHKEEYTTKASPEVTAGDARRAIGFAQQILDEASARLPGLTPFPN